MSAMAARRWPEGLRWGICFALALLIHAGGVAAMLARWTDSSDLASAPVITIELAPIAATPDVTPNDAPPDPEQAKAEPEKKVEPEPQAELQVTPPPKPKEENRNRNKQALRLLPAGPNKKLSARPSRTGNRCWFPSSNAPSVIRPRRAHAANRGSRNSPLASTAMAVCIMLASCAAQARACSIARHWR